jgi:hypothetical protein
MIARPRGAHPRWRSGGRRWLHRRPWAPVRRSPAPGACGRPTGTGPHEHRRASQLGEGHGPGQEPGLAPQQGNLDGAGPVAVEGSDLPCYLSHAAWQVSSLAASSRTYMSGRSAGRTARARAYPTHASSCPPIATTELAKGSCVPTPWTVEDGHPGPSGRGEDVAPGAAQFGGNRQALDPELGACPPLPSSAQPRLARDGRRTWDIAATAARNLPGWRRARRSAAAWARASA